MSKKLPSPYIKLNPYNTHEALLQMFEKKEAEKATSPRTSKFAKQEEGSIQLPDSYELPVDPLNSRMVEDNALLEERRRTDEFTKRVFNNSPRAIEVYEIFKENPKLINKVLLQKLKKTLLEKNINARKIQSAFKKYKEKQKVNINENTFVNKLLTIFNITRGTGKNKRKRRTQRK